MYLIGFDIGSSSVKAALVLAETGAVVTTATFPDQEMPIQTPQMGWAEQHPAEWWEAVCITCKRLLEQSAVLPAQITGIGIAYQMHGLVLLDEAGMVLRPAIIWCDGRAVETGREAFMALGEAYCMTHLLNGPGNFTASKLRWVQQNEPAIFARIHRIMLPGDYIAYRMTGRMTTTTCGLSEGMFWDFKSNQVATRLLEHYQIPKSLIPEIVPVFGGQGNLTPSAATELGLTPGTMLGYRAGDQPNNALALQVLKAGEVAATGGTSGVVYAVANEAISDVQQRVNSFAHVNHDAHNPSIGMLLCINGAGSALRWLRDVVGANGGAKISYSDVAELAAEVPVGSEGLCILPFGNGAERMLGNEANGIQISGIQCNTQQNKHFFRAMLEGIAFSFVYGMEAMRAMGIPMHTLRVGKGNLFESAVFSQTIATVMGIHIAVYDTNGAIGAAKAAGVACGFFETPSAAVAQGLNPEKVYEPQRDLEVYKAAYARWCDWLGKCYNG